MIRTTFGLRSRLLTLVLLAVVPALGLLVYTNWMQRQQYVERVQENARRLARTAALTEERYILGTRQLLTAIAETRAAGADNRDYCDEYLRVLKAKNRIYTLIEVANRKGETVCSSNLRGGPGIADREYFKQAMSTGEFAISAFQIGRVTGRPIITFAYPVRGADKKPDGIVLASHDLPIWVGQLGIELQLPRGTTMTLFDRHGVILATYPADSTAIGRRVNDVTTWRNLAVDEVTVTHGDTLIRAETPLMHGDQFAGTVRMEVSTARAFAEYDQIFRRNAALLGIVSLLALLAAWFGSDFFVLRKTRALVAASHRLAAGDLSARTGVRYGHDELGHLSRVFDDMAWSLQRRQVELLEAERNLASARLSSVLDITADAIVRLDHEGRITLFNRGGERVLGYQSSAVLNRPLTDLLAAESVAAFQTALEQARTGDDQASHESLRVAARRADGATLPAEVTVSRLVEEGTISFTVVLRDITERVAAEEQHLATQQQRAEWERLESLSVLAGGVAHDFNNLLVAVIGNACLGMEETPKGSALHGYFVEIEGAAQKAAGLSLQMLAYSGKSYVVSRRVNLNQIALEAASAARETLPALSSAEGPPQITLDLRVNHGLPDIDGDPAQLKQLLTNLITNAVEAIGAAGGTVIVSTGLATQPARGEPAGAGEHVYVKVSDTGHGIPEEHKARIFEPFFSTRFTGRGLGLAVVSGIVRAHGGFVMVESVPGQGSTFTVLFPRLATDALQPASRVAASAA